MAFVDEITIKAKAGKGGNGLVSWRHEKFVPKGGPAGGDGGKGGNFYIKAVRDIAALERYIAKKEFEAEQGGDGKSRSLHGKNGEDFVLELPVGSLVTNKETEQTWELLKEGDQFILLKGGYGGYGNEHFKSSTNTTPTKANSGGDGEEGVFHIELRIFADIGLVGLPNAGKSSFLNSITNAKAKVASYAFTTLDPNLGDFYGYIIADIPGVIEGASSGKGLGYKFLKHIKRTKMLAHFVSFENEDMMKAYETIRKELRVYDEESDEETGLSKKEEIIILSKSDIEKEDVINKKVKEFEALGRKVFTLSLYDDKSVKKLSVELSKILNNSHFQNDEKVKNG